MQTRRFECATPSPPPLAFEEEALRATRPEKRSAKLGPPKRASTNIPRHVYTSRFSRSFCLSSNCLIRAAIVSTVAAAAAAAAASAAVTPAERTKDRWFAAGRKGCWSIPVNPRARPRTISYQICRVILPLLENKCGGLNSQLNPVPPTGNGTSLLPHLAQAPLGPRHCPPLAQSFSQPFRRPCLP